MKWSLQNALPSIEADVMQQRVYAAELRSKLRVFGEPIFFCHKQHIGLKVKTSSELCFFVLRRQKLSTRRKTRIAPSPPKKTRLEMFWTMVSPVVAKLHRFHQGGFRHLLGITAGPIIRTLSATKRRLILEHTSRLCSRVGRDMITLSM